MEKAKKLHPIEQLAQFRQQELNKMLEGREPSQVLKYLVIWFASPYDVKTHNRFKKALKAVIRAIDSEKPQPYIGKSKEVKE